MSLEKSINQQSNLERVKKHLECAFKEEKISDVILLEYPYWSVCYFDGTHLDSYEFNATIKRSIYKYLKEKTEQ